MRRIKWQSGLSLPELMLTLLISTILMTGIMKVFYDMKQHYLKLRQLTDMLVKKEQLLLLFTHYVHDAGWLGNQFLDAPTIPLYKPTGANRFAILMPVNFSNFTLAADHTSRVIIKTDVSLQQDGMLAFSNKHHVENRKIDSIHREDGRYTIKLDKPINSSDKWDYVSALNYTHFDLRQVDRKLYGEQAQSLYMNMGLGRFEELMDGIESVLIRELEGRGLSIHIRFQHSFKKSFLHQWARLDFPVAFRDRVQPK